MQTKRKKSNRWFKTTAVLLALTVSLGLLCGCSGMPEEVIDLPEPRVTLPEPTELPTEPQESAQPETDPEPATEPEPETEPEPVDPIAVEAEAILDGMTTEEKVAQLFIITPEAFLSGFYGTVTAAGSMTEDAFAQYPVGGVIYLEANLESPEQTREMLSDMQTISQERIGLPVFLCVDEEGGTVSRISGRYAFGIDDYPNMADVGASGDPDEARRIGEEMGVYLSDLGFNLDFAPVADVLTNPDNTVVRYRSFGSDPELVTQMCAAFLDGLQSKGVIGCYKHFPGHGGTSQDSHYGYASSDRSLDDLMTSELLPFIDAAERGAPMIMSGHITLPEVTEEELPASLSQELLTGLLRERLGYRGLLVTDAMNMGAVSQNYEAGEAAVMAIEAGNDLLLMSGDFFASYDAVLAAVESGRISESRLNASVYRILYVKLAWQAGQLQTTP